jgi:nucleoside-diphosphate-sugar epimerase
MIVAITGANGFIGKRLVEQFAAAGWNARAVVRDDYRAGRLAACFDGADVVVHAAGATRAPTHESLHESNVELTRATLDAATVAGVRRFVFISSQAAAGPAASLQQAVTEETVPAPIEAYGRSKLDAEELVRSTCEIAYVIARPAAVYGPGDRDFLALHQLASRGVALHPGNRNQWISILHVRDLANGVISAATHDGAVGGTFFFANAQPTQWKELFRLVARCARRRLLVDLELPRAAVDIAAMAGDVIARARGKSGMLTSDKVALSKPAFWLCSSERVRDRLQFSTPTVLQDGLCETYHWYERNGWL